MLGSIEIWLKGLGLSKYSEFFTENDIDEAALRELTNEDLKDLGVVSVGHRKKLLAAISALPRDGGATASAGPPTTTEAASGAPERRYGRIRALIATIGAA